MAEVGVSVAAKLAEYLVNPTLQQLQYLFCVGKITINVRNKKEELIFKQGWVQERVREAINSTDRIDGEVTKWQDDVERLRVEVENLEQELRANNGRLRGCCPTWRRYRLCKKLANTTQRMIDLITKCDRFNPFSHSVIAPDIENYSSQNFKFFHSTRMAYNQLWEALQDDGISIIGLWGMGGSGKTSLVTEVKKEAKDSGFFHQVVLTTISQNPPIRNIQGEISDQLGLKLDEESNKGRANRIALRLQSGERVLMILDDVWTELNLTDIGIAFGDEGPRYCKVLLTTRSQDVCSSMRCQKTIPLGLLTKSEAWDLFQTHAKVDDGVIELAQQVVTECSGLPIAIVAMGKCLRRKGLDAVNVVLHNLRLAKPVDEDKAFTCLKLSYDNLRSEQAKSFFLLCTMFPEDHEIIIEDLFRYGVGLGLCEDANAFNIARSQVIVAINDLIDSSLLISSVNFNEKCVKMHDMVRDVALRIAHEKHSAIMVNSAKELNELIVNEAVNNWYAFSSWYYNNGLLLFLSQSYAPELQYLLFRSSELLEISHATFEGTKGLKALIIMCTNWSNKIELQPQSIQHLSGLRILRLQGWNLHDISFVVSLTRLEILDLQGSEFARVPDGIENLNKLKLLDLSRCRIDECCYKVIGRCSQLEELYVSGHSSHPRNTNCYEYLGGSVALMKFRRYKLEIGELGGMADFFFQNEGTRSLCLCQLNISLLGAIIKDLAQRATAIQFYELEGGNKCFTPNIVQAVGGMNELTKLCLERCSEIECLTDETTHEDAVLRKLEELRIQDMDNLKQLCLGPPPINLFQKLERLSVSKCPQLLHIFPADCNLGSLKFLEIFDCPMLTSIFPISTVCTLLSLEKLEIGYCNELKHVLAGEGGCNLGNLKFLVISDCPMMTSIFPISTACTMLSLEELKIERCNELKHVLAGERGGDAWGNLRFLKLKKLSVGYCRKLEYACPVFLVQKFEQLQRLSIKHAPQMKFVFGEEQPVHDADETQIVLPPLEYLHLRYLQNLVGICSKKYCLRQSAIKTITCLHCPNMKWQEIRGHQLKIEEYDPLTAIESISLGNCGAESIFPYQIVIKEQIPTFQYLQQLTLNKCARLKVVFSSHTHQCLPKLTSVTISCCEELEAIYSGNEETQKNLPILESCLLKLQSLKISECNKLQFILPVMIGATNSMLPQLSNLTISDCSQMEEIFKCSNIEDHYIDNERQIKFLNMKNMELENLPRLVNICQGFKLHTGKFCRVKVHECPKLVPIMNATIDWINERLVRKYELKKYQQLTNSVALNLPLSVLNVGELDIQSPRVEYKLQFIGDEEQKETNDPEMLAGLVPTQVLSFQYLHSLEVTDSKKLKFLFSISTIVHNNLPKLNCLTLSGCEELEVIFGHSGEDGANYSDTIMLSSLRKIQLKNLPKFMNVCQIGLQIQVELRDIGINNCPKFVNSSLGWALQQLGTISSPQISSNAEQLPGNEEKGMKMLISRAEKLFLVDSMNLTCVWEGPTFIMFQNLKKLCVIKCRKLKCLLPSTVMRSLPYLEYLEILKCEELEEMMSSEEEEEHNHFLSNSLCFPRLKCLGVRRCGKLKWLFPSPTSTQRLSKLYWLRIEECSQLKGLFNCEPEIHEEDFYTNLLPKLKYLSFGDCPMFSKTMLAALESRQLENKETENEEIDYYHDNDNDFYYDDDAEEEMNAMMLLLL